MPPATIRKILAELEARESVARRHTPFGILGPADLRGICRRVATITGTTPDAVAQLRDLHRALTAAA